MDRFFIDGVEIATCSNLTESGRIIDRISEMDDQKYELFREEVNFLDRKYYFRSRNKNSRS